MSTHKRGSRGGKRGSDFRPSTQPIGIKSDLRYPKGHPMNATHLPPTGSATALAAHAGDRYECYETEETVENYLVPRKSLSVAQHLALFPQTLEFEMVTTHQRSRDTKYTTVTELGPGRIVNGVYERPVITKSVAEGGTIYKVENPHLVWKSDKTLLRREKPETLEALAKDVKRMTSVSKRIERVHGDCKPAVIEIPTHNEEPTY